MKPQLIRATCAERRMKVSEHAAQQPGSLSLANQIDRLCDQFELAWRDGLRPSVEQFVAGVDESLRSMLLSELIPLEPSLRREFGEYPTPDDYLARFPDHGPAIEAAFPTVGPGTGRSRHTWKSHGSASCRPHARGGLGEVFVAPTRSCTARWPSKQIQERAADDAESRTRFVLEAEITGRLEHPGIVPVYGLGTDGDGRPYYAMRFIGGDSLKEAIDRFREATAAGGPRRAVRLSSAGCWGGSSPSATRSPTPTAAASSTAT